MNKMITSRNNTIGTIAICIILAALYGISFGFYDGKVIVIWGQELLNSMVNGQFFYYPNLLVEIGFPTNYGLFSNVIVALWLLPVFLFEKLFQVIVPFVFYTTWLKVLIIIVNFLCVIWIDRILQKKGKTVDLKELALLWFGSLMILINSIELGQIDVISIFVLLVAIECFLEKKYMRFAVLAGLSISIKLFSIFAVAVLVIELFVKKREQIYKILLGLIAFPLLQIILEKICFENYHIYKEVETFGFQTSFFLDKVFLQDRIASMAMLILIVALVCYYFLRKRELIDETCIYGMVSLCYVIFYLFVWCHGQWYVYLMPWILFMGYEVRKVDFLLVYHLFNISLIGDGSGVFPKEGYLGVWYQNGSEEGIIDMISQQFPYIYQVKYSVLYSGFLLFLILYVLDKQAKNANQKDTKKIEQVLLWGLPVIGFINYIIIVLKYIM